MGSEYPVPARGHHSTLETQGGVVTSSRTVCDYCGTPL
jgi:hypothetical protein